MTITVSGLREVEAQLAELGARAGTRILRRAMMLGAVPIEQHAERTVAGWSRGSGALHQSIGRRFYTGAGTVGTDANLPPMGGRFSVQIAPLRKNRTALALYQLHYGRRIKGIFYGHLIEFGHMKRAGKKRFGPAGKVPPRPFLLPALQSEAQSAVNIMANEVRAGIERELRKRARKSRA